MFSFLFILPLIGSVKSEAYPRKLEPDEENKLLQEMKNGSREARGKLIEHNLRLVAHIAKKYEEDRKWLNIVKAVEPSFKKSNLC